MHQYLLNSIKSLINDHLKFNNIVATDQINRNWSDAPAYNSAYDIDLLIADFDIAFGYSHDLSCQL